MGGSPSLQHLLDDTRFLHHSEVPDFLIPLSPFPLPALPATINPLTTL